MLASLGYSDSKSTYHASNRSVGPQGTRPEMSRERDIYTNFTSEPCSSVGIWNLTAFPLAITVPDNYQGLTLFPKLFFVRLKTRTLDRITTRDLEAFFLLPLFMQNSPFIGTSDSCLSGSKM
ncbi:hypothetical protein VNO77_15606 [Canavalia gladiata]|uniref:Uncharacterized protein n=1 Tax=Canavalia gladiata TaxID=3824 RepID=A0AAN9M461_CANGL